MTELIQFIINCLSTYYLIEATSIVLLPLGADPNASIYKAQASDQKTYFVKLKHDLLLDTSVAIVELLEKEGIQELIPPIKTVEGKQIQQVNGFTLIVYPFVEGQDGFSCNLTDKQWVALGLALKKIHEVDAPSSLKTRIRREEFSPKWRNIVRSLYADINRITTQDEIACNLKKFLQENQTIIQKIVDCSEKLCQQTCYRPLEFVLCHSDIHGGNVLIDNTEALYIVDWDDPILAPKERDLMFIGGGVGNVWNKPHEERLFYQGYGQTEIDWTLLAYYRYERIVEDIAIYSQELLLKPMENNNRLEMYKQFMNMFAPKGVVDIAFATDRQKHSTNAFENNIIAIYQDKGMAWLANLPQTVEEMAKIWGLDSLTPFENLSYHYVLKGLQKSKPIVLKIALDEISLQREARALEALAGYGAVEVISHVNDALLLQRAIPGNSLKKKFPKGSQEAIEIACEVAKRLHQAPLPKKDSIFPHIREWLAALDKDWDIPLTYLHKARALKNILLESQNTAVLLHGDLHQDNILSNGLEWLVIDPKGVVGFPINEVWAFVEDPKKDLKVIAEYFNWSLLEVVQWYYVHVVLAACWQVEDRLDPKAFLELADIAESMMS